MTPGEPGAGVAETGAGVEPRGAPRARPARDDAALLVVDDNDDNRYTLTHRLKRIGYSNLTTAVNGREALDRLAAQSFDLVLLDIMMPEMNGYEVLERIRADARLRQVPVIMVSAVDELESVVRCIELGAEDYLPKPFNPTLLRARVGASLEKKRLRDEVVRHLERVEQELAAARDIQLSMVPHDFPAPSPERPVEVFATLEPARQVGGDLYDFFPTEDGRLAVVVADVSDKGAPAALFMARTKTLARMVVGLLRPPTGAVTAIEDIVARVNRELCRDNAHGMFVTLFLALLDLATGRLEYVNAGHNVPYLVAPGTGVVALAGPRCKPLGIRAGFAFASGTATLEPGACLFLFTDGITEAMDADGTLFSEERLEATLAPLAGQPPRAVVDAVIAAVRGFAGAAPQSDDIAAMALRIVP
jgi:sigma-B regulation protein RsbU (phosphoserine phosphatase)